MVVAGSWTAQRGWDQFTNPRRQRHAAEPARRYFCALRGRGSRHDDRHSDRAGCLGLQPCQPGITLPDRFVPSSSPGVTATVTLPREDRGGHEAQPLERALQHISIPPSPFRAQNRRAQVGFTRGSSTGATKAMLVLIGAVGGMYAGAYLGDAMDDSEDGGGLVGIPIGAVIGGFAAWTLVR